MSKQWFGIHFSSIHFSSWRNLFRVEAGVLLVALVCAGFTPWRAVQSAPERQLSDSQKARLVRALRPIAPALAHVQLWSDDRPENVRYRQELTGIFEAVGVRTDIGDQAKTAPEPVRIASARDQGVVIVVQDKDRPPQEAIVLVRALRKGGLDPAFAQDSIPQGHAQDFTIRVIGPSRNGGISSTETAAVPVRAFP